MLRAWFPLTLVVVPLAVAGCGSMDSPTSPTRALAQPSTLAMTESAATFQTQALADSSLNGSAYRLTGVVGTSLTFTNAQNTYTIAYDSNTTFRRAVLQSWLPGDPYYPAAFAYNNLSLVDSASLTAFIGGNVRIILVPPNPILPGDPYHIASFQPIP